MKSVDKQVELLRAIIDGKHIYNMNEARFYSRFKHEYPRCITLDYPEEAHMNDPYFKATLTLEGRTHVKRLEMVLA
jgi:hypothetical protein